MITFEKLLVFRLDDQRYALHLEAVERVVAAVFVTPLPDAPEIVLGVINVQGRIVPAINMRRRFRLPEMDLRPSDQFIISSSSGRIFALVADATLGIVDCPTQAIVEADRILPHMEQVEGVMVLEDGMVLIYDIDKTLSLDEGVVLADQLSHPGNHGPETGEEQAERGNEQ